MKVTSRNIILPTWLDKLIFEELGAIYHRSYQNMTVIDWDKSEVLSYLGTYFPRSYSESLCIFSDYFQDFAGKWENKEQISVFDFGSGTGGEIIGLLTALQRFKQLKQINIVAFDGNFDALRLYEQVLARYCSFTDKKLKNRLIPYKVDDFYDMSVLEKVIHESFDIIITFKAICEFVTNQQFETTNPYKHFIRTFLPKLNDGGIMVLVDVTTCNKVSQEWLPIMLDAGLKSTGCRTLIQNQDFNQQFHVSHSHCANDVSKVAWRIIEKKHLKK